MIHLVGGNVLRPVFANFIFLRSGIFLLLVLSVLVFPRMGNSHALNPESIDRYAEITLTPDRLVVIYEVILGISPTERMAQILDKNQDKNITEEERNSFIQYIEELHRVKQIVKIGEETLSLQFIQGDTYRTIGHNGINVLKIDLGFTCELPAGIPRNTTLSFQYRDAYLETFAGWKQIAFHAQDGVQFSGHIPYKEFLKFDYEIIAKRGFIPSTDAIQIEVNLPPQTRNPSDLKITMPTKDEIDLVGQSSGIGLLLKIWMILGGVAVLLGIVYFGIRWMRSSSPPQ